MSAAKLAKAFAAGLREAVGGGADVRVVGAAGDDHVLFRVRRGDETRDVEIHVSAIDEPGLPAETAERINW